MADAPHAPNGDASPNTFSAKDVPGPGKGFRVGEYVIDRSLGHGSMATVYLARDATGHEVALKVFQEGPGVSATMLERFRREAEASKKLRRHPNIMKVYATGHEGSYHYIVMEPVHNSRTFDDCITNTPMPIEDVVGVIIKIARALHFAHTRNIVHRDVKPTNIMMDEFGEPLLTDFGVAALIDWPTCTITGALTGTPLYMSPEQARAERAGPESDVYSLAVVLYEALTGVLPYSAQHAAPVKNVLDAVKNELPKRPRSHRKDISPDLEAVMMKALEKKPEDRYPDAEAFAHDLERALAGRHVTARLFSIKDRLLFLARQHDKAVAAGAAMLILLGVLTTYYQSKINAARYDALLNLAQLRSFALRMAQSERADSIMRQQAGAWPEIRIARRAMNRADWNTAAPLLESAIRLCRETGDTRTMAMAQLDLARLLSVTGDAEQAITLYREILANPDASPPVQNHALLEALILTLLNDQRQNALELISQHALPADNIFRNAILCLSGEMTIDRYQEQIAYLPRRLQNDAQMAIAIRHRMDGNQRAYTQQLRRTIQNSTPANDWPAPLARRLYEEAAP
ncbi:MAG TPA: serine/threonine-protein kinase [Kiritimatiellia bacterium]|nr:serine/threonine-protein kinase [Kiritimatiellia bacterium]HMP00259.1 serine/threonine-protein kinase [Kiritimatiellia bacterium]HMP97513.1 serine/threonine-protein kinase [Kiritimatiellia bacterium]